MKGRGERWQRNWCVGVEQFWPTLPWPYTYTRVCEICILVPRNETSLSPLHPQGQRRAWPASPPRGKEVMRVRMTRQVARVQGGEEGGGEGVCVHACVGILAQSRAVQERTAIAWRVDGQFPKAAGEE